MSEFPACSSNTVPWIIQCHQCVKHSCDLTSIVTPSLKNVLTCQKCLIPHLTLKENSKYPTGKINTDWHIIAFVTTGVATGSRRVKPKDVRDRVSEASWSVLLKDLVWYCDSFCFGGAGKLFRVSWSVSPSVIHTLWENIWSCLDVHLFCLSGRN